MPTKRADSHSRAKTTPSVHDTYVSPLSGRYASPEMQAIWSSRRKFETWRRIWLAVAEAQQACGLDITDEQLDELRDHIVITDKEIDNAAEHEKRLRHDVMAHVHALGNVCPNARPIIHLGMTSQDINDNAELLLIYDALEAIDSKIDRLLVALGDAAKRTRDTPTLGLTHFQPAQPTTVGRRLVSCANDLHVTQQGNQDVLYAYADTKLRGLRGATGTQASYLSLFDADADKVRLCEARFLWSFLAEREFDEYETLEECLEESDSDGSIEGFIAEHTFGPVAQTYPRAFDARVIGALAEVAAVLHKIATDIRLLSGRGELSEPTGAQQIGSSAMPHKRNPMKCERVCALARFVMNLVPNALDTAATQWLERTLDDSANRRLTLPEAFLALDGCLDLMRTVIDGLEVHEAVIRKNLDAQLPFLAGENLMMQAAKLGRDRQDVHEAIRKHARAAADRINNHAEDNDLLDRLRAEPLLEGVDFSRAMDPMTHIGLAREQTDEFLESVIRPLREQLEDDEDAPATDRGV